MLGRVDHFQNGLELVKQMLCLIITCLGEKEDIDRIDTIESMIVDKVLLLIRYVQEDGSFFPL